MLIKTATLTIFLLLLSLNSQAENKGQNLSEKSLGVYHGEVVTKWLPDGRRMELLEGLSFTDPRGNVWDAPKGHIIDGASIPSEAWSIAGGPYSGKYRTASVIHDVACDRKDKPWQTVHLVFYEAMIASGVTEAEARVKYLAVHNFGPRWGEDTFKEKLTYQEYQKILDDSEETSKYIDELLESSERMAIDYTVDSVRSLKNSSVSYITNDLVDDTKSLKNSAVSYITNDLVDDTKSLKNSSVSYLTNDFYEDITVKNGIYFFAIMSIFLFLSGARRASLYSFGVMLILIFIRYIQTQ